MESNNHEKKKSKDSIANDGFLILSTVSAEEVSRMSFFGYFYKIARGKDAPLHLAQEMEDKP